MSFATFLIATTIKLTTRVNQMALDAARYFESLGVRYWTSGKNVTKGWVNIRCPFCDDHSNHLGVSPTGGFHCWLCRRRGRVEELIQQLESVPPSIASEVLKKYTKPTADSPYTLPSGVAPPQKIHTQKNVLPVGSSPLTPKQRAYLRRRRFNPSFIEEKYGVKGMGPVGRYKHRIIIPIQLGGFAVNFTARAIVSRAEKRYLECSRGEALIQKEDLFYGLDWVSGGSVLIVEGVFDCWRVGDGSLGVMGTSFSNQSLHKRILLLLERGVKNVFLMFDSEEGAQHRAEEIANSMSPIFQHVEVLGLMEGDPDESLDEGDVRHLRREIGLVESERKNVS